MSQANLDVMHRFAKEVQAYNNDGLREILAEDIVVHEAPSLPYGGDHHGQDAFIKLFQTVNEIWGFTERFQYTHIPAGDDAVLLKVEVDSYSKATGKEIRLLLSELFTIRDGRIVELEVFYFDTAAMLAALTPR